MENATKALLIAAAVLVAIIIISITLVIVRQGQEAVNGADLSEAEAAQFNSKFTSYEGTNVSTSQVNALLNTILAHNQQEAKAGTNRFVQVGGNSGAALATTANSVTRVTGSNYYTVQCVYNGTIITQVNINK